MATVTNTPTPKHALSDLAQWEVEGRADSRLPNPGECFTWLWANLMHARGLDHTSDPREINAFRLQALERYMDGYNGAVAARRVA